MIARLETPRLLLRPLEVADAEQTQALFPHWEIVRHMTNRIPWPYPADGALTYYRDVAIPGMERGEQWHWSIRLKTAPEQLIGAIGLVKTGDVNRGFWLGLPWQGKGLMTEAAEAVTDYWFNTLGLPVLRVTKVALNIASRRISESQRMRLVATEEGDCVAGRLTREVWEITAEEWRNRKSA